MRQCPCRLLRLAAALVAGALCGCGATVKENHYFAAFKDRAGEEREAVQFYRLSVKGDSHFANARYLTGYFDERAIALFFNELKSFGNASASNTHKLFDDGAKLPGADADTKLTPLTPTPENGAFVLIMSTNADAIASTIGSFAESQVVADALTRVLNKDRFLAKAQSDGRLTTLKAEGAALAAQVDAQAAAASAAASGKAAAVSYRRALTALARGLGYTGPEFVSTKGAADWFALESASKSGGGQ